MKNYSFDIVYSILFILFIMANLFNEIQFYFLEWIGECFPCILITL